MPIRLFNAKRLAGELGRKEVSVRERAHYLVISFLIFIAFGYSGLMYMNPPWSWMSLYEAAALVVITVFGFTKIYAAAGGDSNPDFVVEFSCLYVPVSVTTLPLVWGVYWALVFGFRGTILALDEKHFALVMNLLRIGSDLFGLITFFAVILVQIITLYRIAKLFRIVRAESGGGAIT